MIRTLRASFLAGCAVSSTRDLTRIKTQIDVLREIHAVAGVPSIKGQSPQRRCSKAKAHRDDARRPKPTETMHTRITHRSDAVEKGKREESTRCRGGSRTAPARTLAFFVSNCVSPITQKENPR